MNLCLKKDFCMWMMTVVFLLFFTWSMVTISTLPSLPLEGHRSYQHSLCATTGNGTGLHSSDQAEEPREDRPAKFGEHGQKIASDLAERRASRHAVRQAVEESDASKDTATPAKTEASGRSLAGRQKDLPQHVAAVARHEQDTTRTHTAFISNQLPPPQQDLQGVIKPAMTLSAEKSPKRWGPWKVECASDSQGADVLAGHSEATGGKRQHPSTQGGDLTQLGLKKEAAWYDMATEDSFLDRGNQGVRSRAEHLWWFSEDDIQKMELLSDAKVVSKARVPAHGQVLQVGLDGVGAAVPSGDHADRCEQGLCALIKRPDDWFEVFAFHLDRVLGLNRSLPIVSRKFHSDLLPYRYTSGTARPVVWWDPGIQHLPDDDNDQNSFSLTWLRYQAMLKAKCDSKGASRNPPVCIGIHHSEWGRLALFDFLLQVNDRLDRYCCGFEPDLSEPCVDNLLHAKCGTPNNMVLVHILVRKDDPSKLVFIDNAGRPFQPHANLNFLLVEGIDEFPERAVSVLRSGCLETMLLRSLYVDRDFWESRGGLAGLRPLVRTVQQRGRMLLQHVKDWKLRLNRDL